MKVFVSLIFILVFQGLTGSLKANPSFQRAQELATFAGGCFWCMESPFEALEGVESVVSGYMGGSKQDAQYQKVSSGLTEHLEVVQISYDPKIVSYQQLLEVFWRQIDPTDAGGQFVDRGKQYQSRIYYHSDMQRKLAEESKHRLETSGIFGKKIVTAITKAQAFYKAEDYHQDYYKVNPVRYKYYRYRSGRDEYLESIWSQRIDFKIFEEKTIKSKWMDFRKSEKSELKKGLSPLAFEVTQNDATEPAFDNAFWNHEKQGIYVDIVSGEPLFSSQDKFDSGTGWPSFTRPIQKDYIVEKKDYKLIFPRIEVRSKYADSHLGHVFDDGPKPSGLRYCINSAALRFIPREELKETGYGEFEILFSKP